MCALARSGGEGRGGGPAAGQRVSVPGAHRCRGGLRVLWLLTPVLRDQRAAVQGHAGDPAPAGPADHRRYGPRASLGAPGPRLGQPHGRRDPFSTQSCFERRHTCTCFLIIRGFHLCKFSCSLKCVRPPTVSPRRLCAPLWRASEQSGDTCALPSGSQPCPFLGDVPPVTLCPWLWPRPAAPGTPSFILGFPAPK